MVIFLKVKDNVKNKLNNQFAATFIFFNTKRMADKLRTVKDRGGSSWTPVSKFQQFRARGEKNFRHPMCR